MGYKALSSRGVEGWFMGIILLALPFIILTAYIVKLFLSPKNRRLFGALPPRGRAR